MSFLIEPGFQFSAALDPHRRAAYSSALKSAFKQYAGNPSVAIMGWQAATLIDEIAGQASRIVIVEKDPALVETIQKGVVALGLGKTVTILSEDPETVALDDRVDIVVAGLSTAWFLESNTAQVLANAKRNVLKPKGVMIPRRFVHLFELASSPTNINGISLRVSRYGRPGEPFPVLSESKHFLTSEFNNDDVPRFEVDDTIIVNPLLTGTLTGVRLTTLVELGSNNVHLAGHSGFQSIFMPLLEDVEVVAHQPVTIYVKFVMGEGLEETRFMAKPVDRSSDKSSDVDDETLAAFKADVGKMVDYLDNLGRGGDLDKVVSYTVDPHGDVSRLTALFWTIDEEFKKPVRDLVDSFKIAVLEQGSTVNDEAIYEILLSVYHEKRA